MFLTSTEFCELYKIGRQKMYELMKQGLPHFYVGTHLRFDSKKVQAWFEENSKK